LETLILVKVGRAKQFIEVKVLLKTSIISAENISFDEHPSFLGTVLHIEKENH